MWKLERELCRVAMQAAQVHWYIFGWAMKWHYDRTKNRKIKLTAGTLPIQRDVSVVLIYQPTGILPSLIKSLQHLRDNGFAPVVVSNAPLKANDLEILRQHSFLVMQRPNFGYDFGGYRDAILHLLESGLRPDNLLVMNDSIWFPLTSESEIASQIRAQRSDMYGIVLAERPAEPHRTHLQSYMFSFKKRLVEHEDFERFWRDLPVSSNKHVVIRRCEMRMTHAFKKNGHTIGHLHTFNDVKVALKSLDSAELRRIIAYQIQVDTSNSGPLRPFLDEDCIGSTWRSSVESFIDKDALGKYFLIAHPIVLKGKLGLQILKKDKQPMYQLQRRELFACGLSDSLCPEIRKEMETWDQN